MLTRLFTDHPASVDETYVEHLFAADGFAGMMALGTVVCLVYAVLPFALVKTGSGIITRLHDRMVTNRNRHAARLAAAARTA
ncbi:MAG: DUF6356 family protein [Rhodospirillaceae bacterium]